MEKITGRTKGYCHKCLKVVPADIILIDNQVHIKKICDKHGHYIARHMLDDPDFYSSFVRMKAATNVPSSKIIINLTKKCNLNCPLCYARANECENKEFDKKKLKKFKNYKIVYLLGGEPTVREDLFEIISELKNNHHCVGMFSNGIKLLDYKYASKLKKVGLDIIFLQFDSLDEEDNKVLRGENLVEKKKRILLNLEKVNIPTFPITVMYKGSKVKQLGRFLNYLLEKRNVVGIGFNQMGELGRYNPKHVVPVSEIIKNICHALKVKKTEFIDTTELLINLDLLFSPLTKRRFYSKCDIRGLFLYSKKKVIPLGNILNLKKINEYLNRINSKKNKLFAISNLLFFLFFDQFLFNFFRNQNFRSFLGKFIKNIKFLPRHPFLVNPLNMIAVITFPTYKSIDLNFVETCTYLSIPDEGDELMPYCLLMCAYDKS